jgi:hypothetical protein
MLAFVCALVAAAGCGNSNKTDGGMQDLSNNNDLTIVPPDMAKKPGPSCGAVLGGASGTPPASSKALLMAFDTCMQTKCGANAPTTDDFSLSPCQDMNSNECKLCFSNAQVNCQIDFTISATDMSSLTCSAFVSIAATPAAVGCNGTTTACGNSRGSIIEGQCAAETAACFLDCNSDLDCAGVTCGGNPTTCDVGATNQCIC